MLIQTKCSILDKKFHSTVICLLLPLHLFLVIKRKVAHFCEPLVEYEIFELHKNLHEKIIQFKHNSSMGMRFIVPPLYPCQVGKLSFFYAQLRPYGMLLNMFSTTNPQRGRPLNLILFFMFVDGDD